MVVVSVETPPVVVPSWKQGDLRDEDTVLVVTGWTGEWVMLTLTEQRPGTLWASLASQDTPGPRTEARRPSLEIN